MHPLFLEPESVVPGPQIVSWPAPPPKRLLTRKPSRCPATPAAREDRCGSAAPLFLFRAPPFSPFAAAPIPAQASRPPSRDDGFDEPITPEGPPSRSRSNARRSSVSAFAAKHVAAKVPRPRRPKKDDVWSDALNPCGTAESARGEVCLARRLLHFGTTPSLPAFTPLSIARPASGLALLGRFGTPGSRTTRFVGRTASFIFLSFRSTTHLRHCNAIHGNRELMRIQSMAVHSARGHCKKKCPAKESRRATAASRPT